LPRWAGWSRRGLAQPPRRPSPPRATAPPAASPFSSGSWSRRSAWTACRPTRGPPRAWRSSARGRRGAGSSCAWVACRRRRRGWPESAAVLLRRALAEPPPAAERPGLLLELGIAEATAGQPAGEEHLREALDASGDDHRVALGATLVLAHALGRAERIEDAV